MKRYSILVVIGFIMGIVILTTHSVLAHQNHYHNCSWDCKEEPTPTPTIDPCDDNQCITPSPSEDPSVTPTEPQPTDTPIVNAVSDGQAPQPDSRHATCQIAFDKPILLGFSRLSPSSVEFRWWPVSNIDHYSMRYGYTKDQLVYGVDSIPNTSTAITINGLASNKTVWAVVTAWRQGCPEDSEPLDP